MRELVFPREFTRVATKFADREAVADRSSGYRATFGEHHARVARISNAFRTELGLGGGENFAALLSNTHEYLEMWHVGLVGTGVFTSVNSRASADEITYILNDAGTKVVVTDSVYAALIDRIRGSVPTLGHVVLAGGGDGPHDCRLEDLIAGAEPRLPEEPDEDDPCVLMYTGGTTGHPKGVLLDQRAVMLNRFHGAEAVRPDEHWRWLQIVPMFHVGSMFPVTVVQLAGGALVFIPEWDPAYLIQTIADESVTALGLVATMYVQLVNHPDFSPEKVSTIRSISYGAAPMPYGLLQRMLKDFPDDAIFWQCYGMTEACGTVSFLSPADHRSGDPDVLRSVGTPLAGCDWQIQDPAGNELPAGEKGEVCVRTGTLMQKYWKQPEETAAAVRDGWYHSGDAGYVDEKNYLWITDRVKDMIVTGGENVYSLEVENAISTHPEVARVAVLGVPHEIWGEAVHAVILPREGSTDLGTL